MLFLRIELSWSYIASSLHLPAKLCKPVKTFSLAAQLTCITNGTFGLKIKMITFYKLTLIIMNLIRTLYLSHNLNRSRLKDLSKYKFLHIKLRPEFNKATVINILHLTTNKIEEVIDIMIITVNQKIQMITITTNKFQMKRHIVFIKFSSDNDIDIKFLNLKKTKTQQVVLSQHMFQANKIYKTTIRETITHIITKSSMDTITKTPMMLNLIQNMTTQMEC